MVPCALSPVVCVGFDSPNQGIGISRKPSSTTQRQRQTRITTVKQELTYPNDDPKGKLSQRIKRTVGAIVSQNGLDVTIMHADDDCPGKVGMLSLQRPTSPASIYNPN